MNATVVLKSLDGMLPWDDLPSEEKRKRGISLVMIAIALLLSIVIPFVKVPPKPRQETVAVPERIARVVERKVELPPPPPPAPKEEPKPEAPKAEENTKATPKEAPKPAEVAKARANASKALKEAGLDSLASLRESFDVPMPAGGGGLITSTQEAGTSRNLLTSRAGSGSGGLAAAGYSGQVSSGFGGGKAGGQGSAGVLGTGSLQSVKSGIEGAAVGPRQVNKDGKAKRSPEDIRKTFDRYGGRLNSLYQRALRDDPTMQGTVRLKLTVAPDGSVTSVSVASSQLNNAELESRILAIVKSFDFGADNVEVWSGTHDLNFFPN